MRIKLTVTAALTLVLVVGSVSAGVWWWQWWTSVRPVELVTQRVLGTLEDPDSAYFRGTRYFRSTGAVCGTVNSRKNMGGYAGFVSFVGFLDGDVYLQPTVDTTSSNLKAKLEAIKAEVAFFKMLWANCPEMEP